MWEHLSVLTFWKEAFKTYKRLMNQPLPGALNYVPRDFFFNNHQRSPQLGLAELWQVLLQQQNKLHFPLQFAKRETYSYIYMDDLLIICSSLFIVRERQFNCQYVLLINKAHIQVMHLLIQERFSKMVILCLEFRQMYF